MELSEEQNKQLLLARNLYAIYTGIGDSQNVVALSGVNLDMKNGEFVSVVGPSGSGKSSLLRILGGLQHPSAGRVFYHGSEITKLVEDDLVPFRRNYIGYVFQENNLIPSQSAFMNLVQTLRFSGVDRKEARLRSVEVLERLGIRHRMNALPSKLSGGERQRVAIGRTLVTRPKLILADEPTGNLDYENSESVMGLFQDLHKEENTAFLVVTHSKFISRYADRSIELRDGRFVGEHGLDIDIDNLTETRKVIINPDGTLNLPTEMLTLLSIYGNLWEFTVEKEESAHIIKARPSVVKDEAKSHKYINCPICKKQVSQKDNHCPSCGVSLIGK